jgi:hypothetical protein
MLFPPIIHLIAALFKTIRPNIFWPSIDEETTGLHQIPFFLESFQYLIFISGALKQGYQWLQEFLKIVLGTLTRTGASSSVYEIAAESKASIGGNYFVVCRTWPFIHYPLEFCSFVIHASYNIRIPSKYGSECERERLIVKTTSAGSCC